MNKSEAARAAIEAVYDKPAPAVEYIRETFGIEMLPTHFSAIKSQAKKKGEPRPKAKPGWRPQETGATFEGYVALPPKRAADGDLIETLKALKPLVASLGAEKVKMLADLLG